VIAPDGAIYPESLLDPPAHESLAEAARHGELPGVVVGTGSHLFQPALRNKGASFHASILDCRNARQHPHTQTRWTTNGSPAVDQKKTTLGL
jgi:hypothetical protein